MKINLEDTTLVVVDCLYPELSMKAILNSQKFCSFKKSMLFTDIKLEIKNFEVIQINKIKSINEYSKFILKNLNFYIDTKFIIIIQWDGYIINSKSWKSDFRNYDYIGAKWYWHKDGKNVGNGGFSFRSKKLLEITSSDEFLYLENEPEDNQICRTYREILVNRFGINFADEKIADNFSYERSQPNLPTFGFHGFFNMWRHCSDEEVIDIVRKLQLHTISSREFTELTIIYFQLRKFNVLEEMYLRIKENKDKNQIIEHLMKFENDNKFINLVVEKCEQLVN